MTSRLAPDTLMRQCGHLLACRVALLLFEATYSQFVLGQFGPDQVMVENASLLAEDATIIDVDMDGDLDVVSAITGWRRIVWLENDGAGQFGVPRMVATDLDVDQSVLRIQVGDMDGDGDPDVVSQGSANSMVWFRNNGYGGFSPAETVGSGLSGIVDFAIADMDGDGDTDVVTAYGTVVNYLANSGAGVFAPSVVFTPGSAIFNMTVADVTGDGYPDLLACSGANEQVDHYSGNGLGGFGAPVLIGPVQSPKHIKTADLDQDGDLDVVYSGLQSNTVLAENNGGGSFAPMVTLSTEQWVFEALLADLSGDGLPDLACFGKTGRRVVYRENLGNLQWGAEQVIGEAVSPSGGDAGDLDGDGDLDLVCASSGTTGLVGMMQAANGTLTNVNLTPPFPGICNSTIFHDMDGDGDRDILGAYHDSATVAWFENFGNNQFSSGRKVVHYTDFASAAAAGDFDGDGDMDIAASFRDAGVDGLAWYANDGAMNFTLAQVIQTGSGIKAEMLVFDVNGDGFLDILSTFSTTGFRIYGNDGTGSFTYSGFAGNGSYTVDRMIGVDLDSDGDTDVLTYAYSGGSFDRVIINLYNGNGYYFSGYVTLTSACGDVHALAAGDMDADGDVDVCFSSALQAHVVWMPNLTGTTFGPMQWLHVDADDAVALGIMDINGDGGTDVVLSDNEYNLEALHAYHGLGGGTFAAADTLDLANEYFDLIATTDMDGDGDTELVTGSHSWQWIAARENYSNSPYTVSGSVYHDADLNGAQDPGEEGLPFVMLSCDPPYSSPATGPTGAYTYFLDTVAHTIQTSVPGGLWELTTDSTMYHVQLFSGTPSLSGRDFGYHPLVDSTLLIPSYGSGQARCASAITQWLHITNIGTTRPSGVMALTLDPSIAFLSSVPPPDSVQANAVYWSFDSLGYYDLFGVELLVDMPPGLNTPVSGTLSVQVLDSLGSLLAEFMAPWNDVIICSFDPNDKQVAPAGAGPYGVVPLDTDELDYTIRFQNTGTDTAFHVVIRDQLSSWLDESTLQVIGMSHPLTSLQIEPDRDVVFTFANILLPDSNSNEPASHGFIKYRIRPFAGIPNGTTIANTAAIHFDVNAPVITNTTLTTPLDCDLFTAEIISLGAGLLQANSGTSYQWFLNGTPISGAEEQVLLVLADGAYTVEVTNLFGCLARSGEYVYIGTRVGGADKPGMALFPNPMDQETVLYFSEALGPGAVIELFDIHGRRVRMWDRPAGLRFTLHRGGLPAGIYLLRITDKEVMGALRLVLE
ncbi:MAG: T9SS type A sorting domain-containing protein [Flavobacteriales bacterium]|nr:T9SS type A sorting domain-containing protein [Flavobacteriales bacterium]MBP6695967.1 T9SS type A sorting domain-containing protein [Flavobacteriales bacterium]